MFFGGESLGAIVADIGSQNVRIGFAGEDAPRAFHNSAVGVTKRDGKTQSTSLVPFTRPPPDMDIHFPVVDGVIVDYDLYQQVWEEDLRMHLKTEIKDTPVLLAEKPYQSPTARYKLAEMMFETYGSSALFISKDAVLSCYACGKTSGVSIDMGQSGATICPVVEGFCELKAVGKSAITARLMDSFMLHLLGKRLGGKPRPLYAFNKHNEAVCESGATVTAAYHSFQALELGRDIRETCCRTTETALFDLAASQIAAAGATPSFNPYNNVLVDLNVDVRYLNLPTTSYELPDGTLVDVNLEKYILPELHFEPSVLTGFHSDEVDALYTQHVHNRSPLVPGLTLNAHDGLHKMIVNSVLACDADVQQALLSSLVVFGGNVHENFADRLKNAVESAVYPSMPVTKVKVFTNTNVNERLYSAWLGGSIVASLGSLHEMWVSKKEYSEFGPAVLDRKCP